MTILGLMLILAAAGLSLAVIWANDSSHTTSATTIELFGDQINMTVGEVFAVGAAAGALTVLGLVMVLRGVGRHVQRRSNARHQLKDHRYEMQDLQRKHTAAATKHAANDEAADNEGITSRR